MEKLALFPRIVATSVGVLVRSEHTQHAPFPAAILAQLQSAEGASPAALAMLDDFIHRLFAFNLPKSFFIQMAVAGVWIAMLVIIGGATILSRIWQRSFWIFKATRRSEGTYLVPNALNTFLLLEGVFAFLWIAFIIVQYRGYWIRQDEMQYSVATLNLLIWWPLWTGAFLAGWGSFYTAPGALDKGPLSSSAFGRLLPRPLLINIICVGTPFILIISLIPLMILAQVHLRDSFNAYRAWSVALQTLMTNASDGIAASPSQTQQLLEQASGIWDMAVVTGYYMAIGYAIWPVWAGLFLLFYIPSGGYLCYLVWTQVCRQRRTLQDIQAKYMQEDDRADRAGEAKDGQPSSSQRSPYRMKNLTLMAMRPFSVNVLSTQHGEVTSDPLPEPASSLLFQPLASSQEAATWAASSMNQKRNPLIKSTATATTPTQPSRPRTSLAPFGKDDETALECNDQNDFDTDSNSNASGDVFFPALRPELRQHATVNAKRLRNVGGTPYSRYKYLRRCFVNLLILYIGIVLGAALYLGVSASLGRNLHESYINGPEHIAHIVYVSCALTAWGAVVFGTLCIAAILARFIDPANAPPPSPVEKGQDAKGLPQTPRSPFSLRMLSGKTLFAGTTLGSPKGDNAFAKENGYGQDEKTRTLPAVPHSVGATVDELMTGVSMPTSSFGRETSRSRSTRGHQRAPFDHSTLPKSPAKTLQFDLKPKADGALLLTPTDATHHHHQEGSSTPSLTRTAATDDEALLTSRGFSAQRRRSSVSAIRRHSAMPNNADSQEDSEDIPRRGSAPTLNVIRSFSPRQLKPRTKKLPHPPFIVPSQPDPTAAPLQRDTRPLAPARTPPLSPGFADPWGDLRSTEKRHYLGDELQDEAPGPASRFSFTNTSVDVLEDDASGIEDSPTVASPNEITLPLRRESLKPAVSHGREDEGTHQKAVPPLPEMRSNALFSGLPVSLSRAQQQVWTVEHDNAASHGEQIAFSLPLIPVLSNFSNLEGPFESKAVRTKQPPSIDILPLSPSIMTRRSGPLPAMSPMAPPNASLPPTPTSASAYMAAPTFAAAQAGFGRGDSKTHRQQRGLTIYTDRQTVPSPTSAWTPIGNAGWYKLPQEVTQNDGEGEDEGVDEIAPLDTMGSRLPDAEWINIGSPHSATSPLVEPVYSAPASKASFGPIIGARRSSYRITTDKYGSSADMYGGGRRRSESAAAATAAAAPAQKADQRKVAWHADAVHQEARRPAGTMGRNRGSSLSAAPNRVQEGGRHGREPRYHSPGAFF